jgi:hypothetical protein
MNNMNITLIVGIISGVFTLAAVIVAWFIPQRIMVNQIYADLLREYRSPEFGEAIVALINFYINDCNGKDSRITDEYIKRYNNEKTGDIKNSLHFKRRLLWQFYWDLARLRYEYPFISCTLKRRLKNNFTERESHVLRLLYHTVDGAKKCFDDISGVAEPERRNGKTEKAIYRLYEESRKWKESSQVCGIADVPQLADQSAPTCGANPVAGDTKDERKQ